MMNSMISRGYGKANRTSFHLYIFKKDDVLKLIAIILLSIICFGVIMEIIEIIHYYKLIILS